MKWQLLFFLILSSLLSCNKTYRVAKPIEPHFFEKTFPASPNEVYYGLRWALRTYGYPIAEEDHQNGVMKTRFVPVGPKSHYIPVFDRKDYGVNGAYHRLEVRLVPKGGATEVQIGSRIQSVVAKIHSSGSEEEMILEKVATYLRSPNVQATNLGIQE